MLDLTLLSRISPLFSVSLFLEKSNTLKCRLLMCNTSSILEPPKQFLRQWNVLTFEEGLCTAVKSLENALFLMRLALTSRYFSDLCYAITCENSVISPSPNLLCYMASFSRSQLRRTTRTSSGSDSPVNQFQEILRNCSFVLFMLEKTYLLMSSVISQWSKHRISNS